MSEDFIAKVTGCNIGISFFEGEPEPVIVLGWQPFEGEPIQVAISPEDLEAAMMPFLGACIRARVVQEMVTIYPEQREEIIKNIMFRWAGAIVEETENGEPS